MSLTQEIARLEHALCVKGRGIQSVATAESATGGRIVAHLIDTPGASEYVVGGIVAYSNEAKIRLLGVKELTLAQFGAVSAEVACEMADGARRVFGVDVAISDTGIAGPGGATATKPVGIYYLALATAEQCRAYEFQFSSGDRSANNEAAVQAGLTLLRDYLVQCCDAYE